MIVFQFIKLILNLHYRSLLLYLLTKITKKVPIRNHIQISMYEKEKYNFFAIKLIILLRKFYDVEVDECFTNDCTIMKVHLCAHLLFSYSIKKK